MSAPFGKFPSLRTYLEYIEKECDCTFKEGVNGVQKIFRLCGPDGQIVIVFGLPDGEGLTPTMVSYLDRRLGIETPFPHAPELSG